MKGMEKEKSKRKPPFSFSFEERESHKEDCFRGECSEEVFAMTRVVTVIPTAPSWVWQGKESSSFLNKVDCFSGGRWEGTIAMTHPPSEQPRFRFYASSTGRFLKPDNVVPDLTNPQNWNGYTYVKGNPINFNDPSGHTFILSEKTLKLLADSNIEQARILLKALKIWKSTKAGKEQYEKMKKDRNTSYCFVVKGVENLPRAKARGETEVGKYDIVSDKWISTELLTLKGKRESEGVMMFVNLEEIVSSHLSLEENAKYVALAIAEEAEHALTLGSGEFTKEEVWSRNAHNGLIDQWATPALQSIWQDLMGKDK